MEEGNTRKWVIEHREAHEFVGNVVGGIIMLTKYYEDAIKYDYFADAAKFANTLGESFEAVDYYE